MRTLTFSIHKQVFESSFILHNIKCYLQASVVALLTMVSVAKGQTSCYTAYAYVSNYSSNTVSVINTENNTIVATVNVGVHPMGVSISPDGSRVYITNYSDNTVSVINTATNTVVATVAVGDSPGGVSISPDGTKAYVVYPYGKTLSIINTANNTLVANVAVGSFYNPKYVCVNSDGTRVFVSNFTANNIIVINTTTNAVVATVNVGSHPAGVSSSPDGSKVYVANGGSNTVSIINTATNTVEATVNVGRNPDGISLSPDGKRVYVTNNTDNTLSVINTTNNTILATVNVGNTPRGVSASPDGTKVYVSNYWSNNVSVINTANNTVTSTIAVGIGPFSMGNFIANVPTACPVSAPTITSFTPTSAAVGSTITIVGTGFTGATGVSIGDVAATTFTVENATTITAVVPNGATSGTISITTAGGSDSKSGFVYIANPSITITTANTNVCRGSKVNITASATNVSGTVLYQWYKNSTLISGATAANYCSNTFADADTIYARLTNNGGTVCSNKIVLHINTPVLNYPHAITVTKGSTVNYYGTNLGCITKVSYGDSVVSSFTAIGDTLLKVVTGNGGFGQIKFGLGAKDSLIVGASFFYTPNPNTYTDSLALAALYRSTNGNNWINRANWLVPGMPVASWNGVQTNGNPIPVFDSLGNYKGSMDTGRVTFVNLSNLGLSGRITDSINLLTELNTLDVSNNKIGGCIPLGVGKLKRLLFLELHNNQLTGNLPDTLCGLTQLQDLSLPNNRLSGKIPACLAGLNKLTGFTIYSNRFVDTIPLSIINAATKFPSFGLGDNNFSFNSAEYIFANKPTSPLLQAFSPQNAIKKLTQKTCAGKQVLAYSAAGGTLKKQIFIWNNLDSNKQSVVRGDSTFTPTASGRYTGFVVDSLAPTTFPTIVFNDTVIIKLPPSISITTANNLVCRGSKVNITASTTNVSGTVLYQWYKNSTLISGATAANYCSNTFADADTIYARLTNNGGSVCSNKIVLHINTPVLNYPHAITVTKGSAVNYYGTNLGCITKLSYGDSVVSSFTAIGDTLLKAVTGNGGFGQIKFGLGAKDSLIVGASFFYTPNPNTYTDSLALAALYRSTNGDNWKNKTNWLVPRMPVASWNGVKTNGNPIPVFDSLGNYKGSMDTGRVTFVNLSNLGLSGRITDSIGLLTELNTLDVSNNKIGGCIPLGVGKLKQLLFLELHNNQLTGNLPDTLCGLTQLQDLSLPNNRLSGKIPACLAGLNKLTGFTIYSNRFVDTIPLSIINATTKFPSFGLGDNNFSFNSAEYIFANKPTSPLLQAFSPQNAIKKLTQKTCAGKQVLAYSAAGGTLKKQIFVWNNLDSNKQSVVRGDSTFTPTLSGRYTGLVVDSLASTTFATILFNDTVVIKLPSSITIATANTTVCRGSKVNITASTTNVSGTVLYQWYKNSTLISGATAANYCSNTFADADTIYARITNNGGSVCSNKIVLHINTPVLNYPHAITVTKGSTVNYYGTNLGCITKVSYGDSVVSSITVIGDTLLKVVTGNGGFGQIKFGLGAKDSLIVGASFFYTPNPNTYTDSLALAALYRSTNGNNWINRANWLVPGMPVASWNGVQTNGNPIPVFDSLGNYKGSMDTGRVVGVNLVSNNLTGALPDSIGLLTQLTQLDLPNNQIGGCIPSAIGNLTALTTMLGLQLNKLTGTIPASFGKLTRLKNLFLYNNQLTGCLPDTLCNLNELQNLLVSFNRFFGKLPARLGNLSKLTSLFIDNNRFVDSIPINIINFTNSNSISFANNNFSFNSAEYIFANKPTSQLLQIFSPQNATKKLTLKISGGKQVLAYSGAGGTLKKQIFIWNNLDSNKQSVVRGDSTFTPTSSGRYTGFVLDSLAPNILPTILFNDTVIVKPIPSITSLSPSNATVSSTITITGANFTGATNVTIGGVAASSFTVVNATTITGIVGSGAVTGSVAVTTAGGNSSLGGFTYITPLQSDSLALVDLYNSTNGANWKNKTNWLTSAPLKSWYGVYLTGVRTTDVTVGDRVTDVQLGNNNLSGILPTSIGNLTNVVYLMFYYNNLTGTIPNTLGNCTKLQQLVLQGNKLTGSLPASLANLKDLQMIDVANNGLSGTIPNEIALIPNSVNVQIAFNKFNFDGLEPFAKIRTINTTSYGPQANVPIIQEKVAAGIKLSADVGGTIANNSYHWFYNNTLLADIAANNSIVVNKSGTYRLIVTNAYTTCTIESDTYNVEVNSPSISSFSPKSATIGSTISITGTNLIGATNVNIGGVAASSFAVVNATTITAVVPSGATNGSVDVVTVAGKASLAGFSMNAAPSITSIANQNLSVETPSTTPFSVSDAETPATNLAVGAAITTNTINTAGIGSSLGTVQVSSVTTASASVGTGALVAVGKTSLNASTPAKSVQMVGNNRVAVMAVMPVNAVAAVVGANRTITFTPAQDKIGTATVTVTVTDEGGLLKTTKFDVTVSEPVVASGIADFVIRKTTASIDNCSDSIYLVNRSYNGAGTTFKWYINGTTSTKASFLRSSDGLIGYKTPYPGTYQVLLVVTEKSGKTYSVTKSFTITKGMLPVPSPSFVSYGVNANKGTATFMLNSTTPSVTGGIKYLWTITPATNITIADATVANPTIAVKQISSVQVLNATLSVTPSNGCQAYISVPQAITIPAYSPLVADFTVGVTKSLIDKCNDSVYIINKTTGGIGGNTYTWYLGDGTIKTTTTTDAFGKIYTFPNTYTILLKVTDKSGQSANKQLTVATVGTIPAIVAKPVIYGPNNSVISSSFTLNGGNSSIAYGSLSYLWAVTPASGVATNYNVASTTISLARKNVDQIYSVVLTVKDAATGCRTVNSAKQSIVVPKLPATSALTVDGTLSSASQSIAGTSNNSLVAYPVPVSGSVTLKLFLTEVTNEVLNVFVYNTSGKQVLSKKWMLRNSQQGSMVLNTAGLNAGNYYVEVVNTKGEKLTHTQLVK